MSAAAASSAADVPGPGEAAAASLPGTLGSSPDTSPAEPGDASEHRNSGVLSGTRQTSLSHWLL